MTEGKPRLEVCVTTPRCAEIAARCGADRLELCSALSTGGLTPSPGLLRAVAAAGCPTRVMIRPRSGGFVWDAAERRAMIDDIACLPADGFVIGATLPDGRLDRETLSEQIAAAQGRPVTLHRAFDLCPDMDEALETAIALGCAAILTSARGTARLARLCKAAAGRIEIIAGGGVTPEAIPTLIAAGVDVVHGSFSRAIAQPGLGTIGLVENRNATQQDLVESALAAMSPGALEACV